MRGILILSFCFVVLLSVNIFAEEAFSTLVQEMITSFAQSGKGADDPAFKEKVDEVDKELQIGLERDESLKNFQTLMETAESFSARRNARAMFEPILQRAAKRLQFSRALKDVTEKDFIENMDELKNRIEKYLDPNKPDEDTVDRASLEKKQSGLKKKVLEVLSSLRKIPEKEVFSVEVADEEGQPAKLLASLQDSLVGKIKSLIPGAKAVGIKITVKKDKHLDFRAHVKGFTAPNGFTITEADLDFQGIPFDALTDSSPTEYAGVLDNSTFVRYRSVYDEEQINALPFFGSIAFEMGTMEPGKIWKMPFVKADGISNVIKHLEGDSRFQILNASKAVQEKMLEIKNVGDREILFLQGTDPAGICSVKALGLFKIKNGFANFQDIMLVVDDQLSGEISKFVGIQAINFTLKKAHEDLRKAYPFTMIMEKVETEVSSDGKRMFIFSGKGRGTS